MVTTFYPNTNLCTFQPLSIMSHSSISPKHQIFYCIFNEFPKLDLMSYQIYDLIFSKLHHNKFQLCTYGFRVHENEDR